MMKNGFISYNFTLKTLALSMMFKALKTSNDSLLAKIRASFISCSIETEVAML